MTTHNNTPKDQYHRAPLNGLIIGTIVGAVWALVILGFLITPPLAKQDIKSFPPQFIMSCDGVARRTVGTSRCRLQRFNEAKA